MIEKAKKDYLEGMKYKDLADKYDVSINTVKSWVKRYSWAKLKKGTKGCTQNKKGAHKEKVQESAVKTTEEVVKDIDKEIVEEVLENNELTDKQRLFCLYYIKYFNATKAAIKSGYSKETATEIGYENLRKPHIQKEIQILKQNKLNRAMLSADDIFQRYMDIAFADFNDYAEFGTKDIPVMDHETGKQKIDLDGNPVFYERNYVNLRDSSEVDGTIISEVSQGKDGVKVKLQDKLRAMQWLGDRMNLLPTATRERLELEKAKVKNTNEKEGEIADMLRGLVDDLNN